MLLDHSTSLFIRWWSWSKKWSWLQTERALVWEESNTPYSDNDVESRHDLLTHRHDIEFAAYPRIKIKTSNLGVHVLQDRGQHKYWTSPSWLQLCRKRSARLHARPSSVARNLKHASATMILVKESQCDHPCSGLREHNHTKDEAQQTEDQVCFSEICHCTQDSGLGPKNHRLAILFPRNLQVDRSF